MMKPKQPKAQPPMTIIANDPERLKGERKEIGGSQSDDWNDTLVNQAGNTLWEMPSSKRAFPAVFRLVGLEHKALMLGGAKSTFGRLGRPLNGRHEGLLVSDVLLCARGLLESTRVRRVFR